MAENDDDRASGAAALLPNVSGDVRDTNHLDDKARTADAVILLLEEDVRSLRKRLAGEMVARNSDTEARLRQRIRQLEAENGMLIGEKQELTLRMAAVDALPGRRWFDCIDLFGLLFSMMLSRSSLRSDQNMLQCFLAAASVGEMNFFLDELNTDVRCSCLSCFALKRRC
jgi:hypothetical protein